jgi:hypothetical protein
MSEFDNIKVGDMVCVQINSRSAMIPMWRHMRVTKVTATQFTVEDGDRYLRRSGVRVGRSSRWGQDGVHLWTPERAAENILARRCASAERACAAAAKMLDRARGEEAIRLAALLPDELKEPQP